MTDWTDVSYIVVALIVAALLMYVMQKVEYDRWSKTDPLWLQWIRRFAFVSAALVLLYSIQSIDWRLTSLLLITASGVILAINALALSLRSPPNSRGKARYHPSLAFSYVVARVISYFSAHR